MFILLGFIFWLIVNPVFAANYNFDDLLIGSSFSDLISSASFKQISSSGQNVIGEASSTGFILRSGFLYYPDTTATSTPPPPTTQYSLTIQKSGNGSGVVTTNPSGINCGSACNANFDDGTSITLVAVSDSNSFFVGWSGGGCSGTSNCVVVLNSSLNVTATFTMYSVTSGGGGSSGGGGGSMYIGGIGGVQVPCMPPKGDINRDCKVNLIDLSILAYWWERPLPPITVDMNKNGVIDTGDFSILVFYWTG